MDELFNLGQHGPERPDISLCIFPHLKEFLVIDLRWDPPRITLLHTDDIFDGAFFNRVEGEFNHALREVTEHPFAHLMDLPIRVEEITRELGMMAIMERLGARGDEDEFPTVAVFIIGGSALAMSAGQITLAFGSLLGEEADQAAISQAAGLLERLITEEGEVVRRIDQQELRDALEDQSPNFLTLWERRN